MRYSMLVVLLFLLPILMVSSQESSPAELILILQELRTGLPMLSEAFETLETRLDEAEKDLSTSETRLSDLSVTWNRYQKLQEARILSLERELRSARIVAYSAVGVSAVLFFFNWGLDIARSSK